MELQSGIQIADVPRFTMIVGKSAEYGIPIAIQCRYVTQHGIPHSPRIAIGNRNTELQVTFCPNLAAAQILNRASGFSDDNC